MQTKRCSKCERVLPATTEYFYKNKNGKYGLNSWCKKCHRKFDSVYRRSEKRKISLQRYSHSEKGRQSQKRYAATVNGNCKRKNNSLKSKYSITLERYNQMLVTQDGVCAVCGRPETAKNKWGLRQLCVDHDHKTGRIRGLLCDGCNRMMGHARENVATLLAAGIYLER